MPYLKGEQIKVRVKQLSARPHRGADNLFKSQSYEQLVARERALSTPAIRHADDRRMWNDFFSVPVDHEDDKEISDDLNEVRLTYIEVRVVVEFECAFE